MSLLLLYVDRDLADQLAEAVARQRQVAAHLGRVEHPWLAPLGELLERVARGEIELPAVEPQSAPTRSRPLTPRNGAIVEPVRSEWLTTAQCAAICGLGSSTVRRHVASGSLPSSKIGRSRRIARADLVVFMRERAEQAV